MGYANGSSGIGGMILLLLLSLIATGTPVAAQTGQDSQSPPCTDPPCPKINVASTLVNGPEEGGLENRTEPVETVLSQVTPRNHRLFWVLPDYLFVENLHKFEPLSIKTKFKLTTKTMTDPVTLSFIAVLPLIGQARNSDPSYGQGLQGYEKRVATFFANTGISTLMTTSVFPTVLHQDPRYFQLGRGGVRHRALYSMSRIFVTKTDSDKLQFNYSEIVGNAVAAGISNAYLPQNQRTLGHTLNVWGTDVMLNMLCNVAKEFWPDIRRKFHKQQHPD